MHYILKFYTNMYLFTAILGLFSFKKVIVNLKM